MLSAPIARIVLRYGAGYLVLNGLIGVSDGGTLATDADALALVELAVGGIASIGTEVWYWAARKFGWSK